VFQEFRPGRSRSTATAPDPGPVYGIGIAVDPHAAATTTLLTAAGATQWPLAEADQKRMVRRARAKTHPDLYGGDQSRWDAVQAAARVLRLA
jgi:hypothetical protein